MKSKCYYLSKENYLMPQSIDDLISFKILDNTYDKTEGDNCFNIVYDYFLEIDENDYINIIKLISKNMIMDGKVFYKTVKNEELNQYYSYITHFLFQACAIYCYKIGFKRDLLDILYMIKYYTFDEMENVFKNVEEAFTVFNKFKELLFKDNIDFYEIKCTLLNCLTIFVNQDDFTKL